MKTSIRQLRRRQRRQKKLRILKARLAEARDFQTRERLIAKIRRVSVNPKNDLPDA